MQKRKSNITDVMLLLRALAVFTGSAACIFLFFFLFPQQKVTPRSLPISTPTPSPIVEKISCGGIAGKQCPTGYVCKLDGKYPDAGGYCVKTLKTSPTCIPRPSCLDTEPRCMIPETPDMCPKEITPCKHWETICDPNYTDPNGGCAPKTVCAD